ALPATRAEHAARPAADAAATPAGSARTTGTPAAPVPAGSGSGSPSGAGYGTTNTAPTLATWRAARAAQTPAENDAWGSMGTGAWLDANTHPDQDFSLSFHQPRGEVYITSGGRELDFGAIHEVARTACLGLRDLRTAYPDLPYRTYVIVDTGHRGGPAVVWADDFRANTACSTSVTDRTTAPGAGQAAGWYPDAGGLAAAQVPSRDPDEIRVADRIATSIIRAWSGNSSDHGYYRLSHDNLSVGFDPEKRVMYVWAAKPAWDGTTRGEWAHQAAQQSCTQLAAASADSPNWPYTRYAVLIEDPTAGDEFLLWGSSGACEA
ncbi:hypothetical protein ACEPPI_23530, partial [Streptomyces sp. AB3(2024)]